MARFVHRGRSGHRRTGLEAQVDSIALGAVQDGTFQATEVLAKHDEKYMPPEVVESLKRSGRWKEGQ